MESASVLASQKMCETSGMGACRFQVADRVTKKARVCRMQCVEKALCYIHSPRQQLIDMQEELKSVIERVTHCERAISSMQREAKRPAPPPPPPPPGPSCATTKEDMLTVMFGNHRGSNIS